MSQHIKKQRHYFVNKGPSNQSYGFPMVMYGNESPCMEMDYKENWATKYWCFWTVVLEKTPESLLDCTEIQPVHPKGDKSWVFIGRTDVEAETPVLWPPDVKSWLIWKDPDAGKDWGAGGEGDDRGCYGWMASPTQWTWIWVDSLEHISKTQTIWDRRGRFRRESDSLQQSIRLSWRHSSGLVAQMVKNLPTMRENWFDH